MLLTINYPTPVTTVKVSAPLCPNDWAPLYYGMPEEANTPEAKSGECPTCKKKFRFPKTVKIAQEIARRHAIGLAAREERFKPSLWTLAMRFLNCDLGLWARPEKTH